MERGIEPDRSEPVPVSEGIEQCAGDERVADVAGGELQGGVGVLDLDARRDRDRGALGSFGELAAGWIRVPPSDDAIYITGAELAVDGGYLAR